MVEQSTLADGPSVLGDEGDPSRLQKIAAVATALLRHKELIVAAMEALRERQVLTEDEEVKVIAAYEQGSAPARSAIHDLLQKLQRAELGRVVVDLHKSIEQESLTPQRIKDVAQPYLAAARDVVSEEARPYLERAKQRLVELKALEEPTLRRLEAVSENFKLAGKEVATGLKGVGREAADELVRRGKRLWMSAETEELEREFFDWSLKTLPKAEQALVRLMLGTGTALLLAAGLLAAREVAVLKEMVVFVSVFLLVFTGLAFLSWGAKVGQALKGHKSDIEKLARMPPAERRIYLTQRWAKRAQEEGVITSNEAQTVIMQTIQAAPEPEPEAAPGPR